jgi:hypothetical protein
MFSASDLEKKNLIITVLEFLDKKMFICGTDSGYLLLFKK